MPDTHAIILAGGAGTRLWPLSRRMRPKQLLRLFDGKSLLQHAIDRLDGLFDRDNIHIVTTADLARPILDDITQLTEKNIIAEPALRDTANAIGLAANLIARKDPDAVMCVFTADHLITPRDKFRSAVQNAINTAQTHADALVTFGIQPTSPHTGYGYVQLGDKIDDTTRTVAAFREKPDAETAKQYVASGNYLWNSGMFVWRVATIIDRLRAHLPDNQKLLEAIAADWETAGADNLRKRYESLHRISIDFGVMEKAPRVLVVPMDCDWVDVGSWESIAALHAADAAGNVAVGAKSLTDDARNNTLVSEREHLIVTVGVDDLIVVHSENATLVCSRQHAQRIRDIVKRCQQELGDHYT